MTTDPQVSEFFTAGGTLPPDAPSYVKRSTDDELFQHIMAREFCYVLTPRQMGKSSLMIRTAQRLSKEGVKSAIVDLTQIGTVQSEDQWYKGILTQIARRLRLTVDPVSWWEQRKDIPNIQKFIEFFEDTLSELIEPIVIFMDEIDTTLKLDFRDNFFAGVRALFNARAANLDLKRITFVLLGVASPSDLIKDRNRTPFNIGQEILLRPFSREDARMLEKGLEGVYPKSGGRILDRIFYWTNGHPYLTQKICQSVVENHLSEYNDYEIDKLVEKLFITEEASRETNLQFVRDNILSYPERRVIISLYKKLLRKGDVRDNKNSIPQNHLKLSGLARAEDGRLVISNKIYSRVFNHKWVTKYTEVDWRAFAIGALSLIVIGFSAIFYIEGISLPNQAATKVSSIQNYKDYTGIKSMAELFDMNPVVFRDEYDYRARDTFFNLLGSWEDQKLLIEIAYGEPHPDQDHYRTVITGLYTSLADIDDSGDTTKLLDVMYKSLNEMGMKDEPICQEIGYWLEARKSSSQNNFRDALDNYNNAINLNSQNPATLFERARIYTQRSEYEKASDDYEAVIIIAVESASAPTSTPVPTATIVPTKTSILKPTLTSTSKPILTHTLAPTLGLTQMPGARPTLNPSTPPTVATISSPTLITTTTLTESPPSGTPSFTPTTPPESVRSRFSNSEQQFAAVRNEIIQHNELLLFLLENQDNYVNLADNGMVPTLTPIPTNTQTSVSSSPPSTSTPTLASSVTPSSVPQSSILYQEDFEDGVADGWTNSTWTVVNENGNYIYRGTGPGDYPWSYPDENFIDMSDWTDYAFESRIRFTRGTVFIVARMINQTEFFYTAVINGDGRIDFGDWNVTKEGYTNSATNTTYPIQTNKWYTVRFELKGDLQTLYIDEELVLQRQHSGRDSGGIGFYIVDTTVQGEEEEIYFDDIRVWSLNESQPQATATISNPLIGKGKIIFHSDRDSIGQIYIIDQDSGKEQRLTSLIDETWNWYPAWSPDGKSIAFTGEFGGNNEIYIMDLTNNVITNLTNNFADDRGPAWSPDGKKIAFRSERAGNPEIYIINVDGTGLTRLTNNNCTDDVPSWSPDSVTIAYSSDCGGYFQINLLYLDGNQSPRQITNSNYDSLHPAWSPDGKTIAFHAGFDGTYDLYVMNPDGSGVTNITKDALNNQHPTWSPDGQKIAFQSDRSGDFDIYVINIDGSDIQQITTHPDYDGEPAWALNESHPTPTLEPFPITADAYNITKLDDGTLLYYTKLSLEDTIRFYRDEYTTKGYTEREALSVVSDGVFSIVFDGDPSGKAIVIQSVDLGDGSRTVTVRLEDV